MEHPYLCKKHVWASFSDLKGMVGVVLGNWEIMVVVKMLFCSQIHSIVAVSGSTTYFIIHF